MLPEILTFKASLEVQKPRRWKVIFWWSKTPHLIVIKGYRKFLFSYFVVPQKRFMAFIKPFELSQRSAKMKIKGNFYSDKIFEKTLDSKD